MEDILTKEIEIEELVELINDGPVTILLEKENKL